MAGSGLGTKWRTAGITGYVMLAGAGLIALAVTGVAPGTVGVLAVVATAGLVGILTRTLGNPSSEVRRLVADTAVIVDANAAHRLAPPGSPEVAPLAAVVNRLAEAREEALKDVAEQAAAARRDVEAERNRLAALMAQLTVAVVVCNKEGRILLYNEAARSLVEQSTPIGLGRSVFTVVDRGLMAHAYDRLTNGAESAYTGTTLLGDQLLRVRIALVREPPTEGGEPGPGFVVVLEDLTREVRSGDERERLLRQLVEGTRASLGSIQAAVESVLEFPGLTAPERHRFLEIVREEADLLGHRVEDLAAESAGDDRLLIEIAGDDLLGVLRRELSQAGIECAASPVAHPVWLRVDGHAVARAVTHVLRRLAKQSDLGTVTLVLTPTARHGQLDACWRGRAPSASVVDGWLDEPPDEGATATARDIADRHGAEIWSGDLDADTAYLRVLLPLADGATTRTDPAHSSHVVSRPEFYDFDLFTAGPQPADRSAQRLDDMSFTVFDTETTGLDPAGGDRIVSIGAVRVVNGRVLRQETFERLVQPQRTVPRRSTEIHGITAEMLEGQPTISQVLPAFARFAEDTVLVGHNVSFDLQFIKLAEPGTEMGRAQPALDTLLLHAALHPDQDDHTLEAIAGPLGVSVVGRHTALGDALVTAEVFVGLIALLRRRGVDTLGRAVEASRRTFQLRADES